MNPYFGFLFARPSFAEGAARALDFGNTLQEYNTSLSPEQADALALQADWGVVGNDLRLVMQQLSDEETIRLSDELLAEARAALAAPDQLKLALS